MSVRGAAGVAVVVTVVCSLVGARQTRADDVSEPAPAPAPPASEETRSPPPALPAAATSTDGPTTSAPLPSAAGAEMNLDARIHYDEGLRLYAARQFAAAVRELELGFAVDPRPEFLFAEAQALRLAGACANAVAIYQRFLEAHPSPIQVDAARLGIARCAPERAPARPANASAAPMVAASPAPFANTTATATAAPHQVVWWHDAWAGIAIGGGIAALAVATGFEIASRHARDDMRSTAANSYPEFAELSEVAQQRRAIAVSSFVAGVALLAAGGVRLVVLQQRDRAARPASAAGVVFLRPPGGGLVGGWKAAF